MRSEKPCNNSLCDVFSTCNEGKGVGDYRRTCHRYQRYLGQQEGQSERDALRAEVEVLKKIPWRILVVLRKHKQWDAAEIVKHWLGDQGIDGGAIVHPSGAISEARKGE